MKNPRIAHKGARARSSLLAALMLVLGSEDNSINSCGEHIQVSINHALQGIQRLVAPATGETPSYVQGCPARVTD